MTWPDYFKWILEKDWKWILKHPFWICVFVLTILLVVVLFIKLKNTSIIKNITSKHDHTWEEKKQERLNDEKRWSHKKELCSKIIVHLSCFGKANTTAAIYKDALKEINDLFTNNMIDNKLYRKFQDVLDSSYCLKRGVIKRETIKKNQRKNIKELKQEIEAKKELGLHQPEDDIYFFIAYVDYRYEKFDDLLKHVNAKKIMRSKYGAFACIGIPIVIAIFMLVDNGALWAISQAITIRAIAFIVVVIYAFGIPVRIIWHKRHVIQLMIEKEVKSKRNHMQHKNKLLNDRKDVESVEQSNS